MNLAIAGLNVVCALFSVATAIAYSKAGRQGFAWFYAVALIWLGSAALQIDIHFVTVKTTRIAADTARLNAETARLNQQIERSRR